jgi:hypothetical protein
MPQTLRFVTVCALLVALAACNGATDPLAAPPAPALALEFTAIKTFTFTWSDVAGETEYRLLEDPDGASGATEIAVLPADTESHELEVGVTPLSAGVYVSRVGTPFGRLRWARSRRCDAASCMVRS